VGVAAASAGPRAAGEAAAPVEVVAVVVAEAVADGRFWGTMYELRGGPWPPAVVLLRFPSLGCLTLMKYSEPIWKVKPL
jgi:hypothetical protein